MKAMFSAMREKGRCSSYSHWCFRHGSHLRPWCPRWKPNQGNSQNPACRNTLHRTCGQEQTGGQSPGQHDWPPLQGSPVKYVDRKQNKGLYTCLVWLSQNRRSHKKDKAQHKNTEKANRGYVFPSSTNNLFPYQPMFVNYFHATQNQYMVSWLLKDAQLTCNRCPFEVLLTPFWSPIKHLFLHDFITNWFTVGCKLAFYTYFYLYL